MKLMGLIVYMTALSIAVEQLHMSRFEGIFVTSSNTTFFVLSAFLRNNSNTAFVLTGDSDHAS